MQKNNHENLIRESFAPSNVFSEEILISNNTVFKDKVSEFLSSLNNKYNDFKNRLNTTNQIWEDFNKNNEQNVHIEVESMSIKSPTTILNAPWGTGKTYFIEQIALNWNSNEIKKQREKFENFIVIDTWKFTTKPNVLETIMEKIYFILCKISNIKNIKDKKNEYFKKIWKILKVLIFRPISNILKEIEQALEEENNKSDDSAEEFLKNLEDINKNIKPTIIVFDNIERMGIHSWEIIKTIQQLSIFDNLLFLLPINKTQLSFGNNFEYETKNESAIDKYITLGVYFNLKQDYLGILNELNFNENDAQLINKILNAQINGYNLSIRLVERAFLHKKIKESFDINKYQGLKQLRKIWTTDIIKTIIEDDIKELKENYINLFSIFNSKEIPTNAINTIKNFLDENKDNEHFQLQNSDRNFVDELDEIFNEFNNLSNNLLIYINHTWLDTWREKYIINLNYFKKHLNEKIKHFENRISDNTEIILKNVENNKIFETQINENQEKLNKLISRQQNKGAEPKDPEQQINLEEIINKSKDGISRNKNIIQDLEKQNTEFNNFKNQIHKLINNDSSGELDIFINEFKKFCESYNVEWSNLKNDKNKYSIISILELELEKQNNNISVFNSIDDIFNNETMINTVIQKLLY